MKGKLCLSTAVIFIVSGDFGRWKEEWVLLKWRTGDNWRGGGEFSAATDCEFVQNCTKNSSRFVNQNAVNEERFTVI